MRRHIGDDLLEHLRGLGLLALKIIQYCGFGFSGDDVNLYGLCLAKPPETADGLVKLLVSM